MSYQYPGRFNLYASVGALVASASSQQITNPNQLNPIPTILLPSGLNSLTDGAVPFQPVVALPGAPVTSGVSASASDWLANLRATFFIDNTTQLILVAAQSVSPNSFGNIFKTDSVGVVLRKQVNYSTGLVFAADASRLDLGGYRHGFLHYICNVQLPASTRLERKCHLHLSAAKHFRNYPIRFSELTWCFYRSSPRCDNHTLMR